MWPRPFPVPCTVSLGAEPAHDDDGEWRRRAASGLEAASPRAAPPTSQGGDDRRPPPATRAVPCSIVDVPPRASAAHRMRCARRRHHRFRRTPGPNVPAREHRTGSARQERTHLLAEGGDLVAQLVHGAVGEPHLEVRDAHVDQLGQVLGDALGAARHRAPRAARGRARPRGTRPPARRSRWERRPAAPGAAPGAGPPGRACRCGARSGGATRRRAARPGATRPETSLPPRWAAAAAARAGGRPRGRAAGQRGPASVGNSSRERRRDGVDGLVEPAPPRSSKGGPKRSNSSLTCPAPTPMMTRPPDRTSRVENSLAARKRVALGGDVDVGHQPDPGRDPRQPPQRGDGVVPRRAHGPGQAARDGGVVAHRHVEEPAVLGLARHPGQLGRTRRRAPSPPRRSWTATGSAAGCRRRPVPRG